MGKRKAKICITTSILLQSGKIVVWKPSTTLHSQ